MLRKFIANFKKPQESEEKFKSRAKKPIIIQRDTINDKYAALSVSQVRSILLEENFSDINALYFLMLQRDLHLASEVNKRKMQLLTTEYMIEGSEPAKKFATAFLDDFKFSGFLHELSSAIPYGFSFVDLVWDVKTIDKKTAFVPVSYRQLSQRFVYADNEDQKFLKDTIDHLYIKNGDKKNFISKFDDRKLISHIHKTDTGFITDFVLLNKVAWFVALKHSVIAANMQWYDALGTPPLIVNYDSDDEDDLQFLLSQALSLRGNGVGIFPQEAQTKLLEGKGSKGDFLSFVDYIDGTISQYLLGNTLAGGDANKGSYGTAKIHAEIKKEYLVFDAKMISETVTRLLNIILAQNFTNETVKFSFVIEDTEGHQELSATYKNLKEMGFEIPVEHIEKKFNIKGITKVTTATDKTAEPNRIEHNKKKSSLPIDHIDSEMLKLNTKEQEEEILQQVLSLIDTAESYEEALENMLKNYPDMHLERIEKAFATVIANAHIQGDFDASQD